MKFRKNSFFYKEIFTLLLTSSFLYGSENVDKNFSNLELLIKNYHSVIEKVDKKSNNKVLEKYSIPILYKEKSTLKITIEEEDENDFYFQSIKGYYQENEITIKWKENNLTFKKEKKKEFWENELSLKKETSEDLYYVIIEEDETLEGLPFDFYLVYDLIINKDKKTEMYNTFGRTLFHETVHFLFEEIERKNKKINKLSEVEKASLDEFTAYFLENIINPSYEPKKELSAEVYRNKEKFKNEIKNLEKLYLFLLRNTKPILYLEEKYFSVSYEHITFIPLLLSMYLNSKEIENIFKNKNFEKEIIFYQLDKNNKTIKCEEDFEKNSLIPSCNWHGNFEIKIKEKNNQIELYLGITDYTRNYYDSIVLHFDKEKIRKITNSKSFLLYHFLFDLIDKRTSEVLEQSKLNF